MTEYEQKTYDVRKDYALLSFDEIVDGACAFLHGEYTTDLAAALRDRAETLRRAYRERGAILIRGDARWTRGHHSGVQEMLESLGGLLQQDFYSYEGGHAVRGAPIVPGTQIFRSTYATPRTVIPQHNEMSFKNRIARTLVFLCRKAPDAAGQTPLTRNVALNSGSLAEQARLARPLTITGFVYSARNRSIPALLEQLKPHVPEIHHLTFEFEKVFGSDDPDVVERYYAARGIDLHWFDERRDFAKYVTRTTMHIVDPIAGDPVYFSQLHYNGIVGQRALDLVRRLGGGRLHDFVRDVGVTFEGTPVPATLIHEINTAIDAHTRMFDWQVGDVLIVNNLLVMHGRNSFAGEREILTAIYGGADRHALCQTG